MKRAGCPVPFIPLMTDRDIRMRGFQEKTDLRKALEILRSCVQPPEEERIRLEEALGRTMTRDVVSTADLPSFDKSAMDGFALRAAETFGASPTDPPSSQDL